MQGVWIDRTREAWEDECDGAFLDRIDMLVMAEWDRRRRANHLQRLCDDYAVRVEFLLTLQDLIAIREATGCIAALPSRRELELLLNAIRHEHLGQPDQEQELIPAGLTEDEWDLPEDEPAPDWRLEKLAGVLPPGPAPAA